MSGDRIDFDIFKILLDASFVVKLDLLVLLGGSIASWGIIIGKLNFFKKLKLSNERFEEDFMTFDSLEEAYDEAFSLPESSRRRLFILGYEEFLSMKESCLGSYNMLKDHFSQFSMISIERAMNNEISQLKEEMDESLTFLASIASVSPFVGLFGTVWGIVNSFTGLSQGGGANLEAVAPGIAEALVATAIGLVVAIPAVWFFNIFSKKKLRVMNKVEVFKENFINKIEKILIREARM